MYVYASTYLTVQIYLFTFLYAYFRRHSQRTHSCYIYIYMCIYTYIQIYMCIYIYIYIYMHIHSHIYIYIHTRMQIYTNIQIFVYVYLYILICIYIYMYTCIYKYMYIHINICMHVYASTYLYVQIHLFTFLYAYFRRHSQRTHSCWRRNTQTSIPVVSHLASSTLPQSKAGKSVAHDSMILIIRLCGEYRSLLQGSFAKETYNFKEPTSRSHPRMILSYFCFPFYFWGYPSRFCLWGDPFRFVAVV